ncbi:hypothetical protein FRB90_008358 [Tulasnella sp. 427]|nr:hypothetical protein FRB90_008358 [Tulasnella sp. 427]
MRSREVAPETTECRPHPPTTSREGQRRLERYRRSVLGIEAHEQLFTPPADDIPLKVSDASSAIRGVVGPERRLRGVLGPEAHPRRPSVDPTRRRPPAKANDDLSATEEAS